MNDNSGQTDKGLTFRTATIEDAYMIFTWRNLPEMIVLGRTQRPVKWEEHYRWFRRVLMSGNHVLLIVLLGREPIGQVRFDRLENRSCEVSIYLLTQYTGRGLGVKALKYACREAFTRMGVEEVIAVIREDNQRSISAFQKAGFSFVHEAVVTKPGFVVLSTKRRP